MHKSTGNDIVDLGSINKTRTSEPRFYSKIISVSEKQLFQSSPGLNLAFEVYIWLAWSVKESVYKFLKRHHTELVFSPTKLILQSITPPNKNNPLYIGTVTFNGCMFYYQSEVTDEYISTIVNNIDNFEGIKWGMRKISPANKTERSAMALAFLLDELRNLLGDDIQVEKSEVGYPVVLQSGVVLDIAISLSHDGEFVACSIKLNL